MIKRPMKGNQIEIADFEKLVYPRLASPKIDGFRCVLGQYPMTSRLSRFPNEHFHQALSGLLLPDVLLDAEAVVGRRRGSGVLQRTSSGLTSKAGIPDFTLWVFDCPGHLGYDFIQRHTIAQQIVKELKHPQVKILRHHVIRDAQELEEYLEDCLERGYEGIMTRSPDGPYKEGKATLREGYLLKVKPFDTAEGRIKGWFEEEQNTNEAKREATGKLKRSSSKEGKVPKGRLGGFILHDIKDGFEVRVGGGFTKSQRIGLWKLIQGGHDFRGTLVRYSKQRVGQKDKPRHPNFTEFVDFRPEWDFVED